MEAVKGNEFRGIEFTEEQKEMLKDRGYNVVDTHKKTIVSKVLYEDSNFKIHFTINPHHIDYCGCLWIEALYEEISVEELDAVNVDVSKILGELFFLNDIGINISDFFRKEN